MTFRLLAPATPPETGYVDGIEYPSDETLDGAIAGAKAAAAEAGPGSTVLVDHGDGVTNTSVTYRPGQPRFLGLNADHTPNLQWEVEYRIVTDSTYVEQSFAHPDGPTTEPGHLTGDEIEEARQVKGSITVHEEVAE